MAERNLERYVGFHRFGGVDLSSAPDEAECIDMLNVDPLERPGAILTRPAWVNRGPGLDDPIVAFKHGRVQDGSDGGQVTTYLTGATGDWLPFYNVVPFALVSKAIQRQQDQILAANLYDLAGDDMEVYVQIDQVAPPVDPPPGVLTQEIWLFLRARVDSRIWAGFIRSGWDPNFLPTIVRPDGSPSFGSPVTLETGDWVGARVVGEDVEVWVKQGDNPWAEVHSTSVDPTGNGYPGLYVLSPHSTVRLTNFGAGPSTGGTFPESAVVDDFDRADEESINGSPTLVAFNHDTGTEDTRSVMPSMFLDAVQFSHDTGSVILATENVKTATNVGINVIEADSSDPYVKITPMVYQSGPPDAPDLDWVKFLGVQQPDNRVVAAGVGKGLNHEARVYFSDPGDHTAWNAENYVDLGANDGEVFTGICDWRGQLWVFKETRAFVFYGNSVDQFGGPEFNYRAIDLGVRVVRRNFSGSFALGPGVAAGEAGVYFVGQDGIYLVDGRDAVKISQPIDSLLLGPWGSTGGTSLGADDLRAGLWYEGRRLYVNAGHRIYVWDELRRGWLVWQSPAPAGSPVITPWIGPAGTTDLSPALALIDHPDGNNLWSLARPSERSITTDGGDPIPARYRLGFSDFGSDYVDRLEETRVTGTGTVTVTVSKDFERTGQAEELELTDPPSVLGVPGLKRFKHGISGVVFSTEIEGDAPWAIHRIVHAVSSQKAGGTS